MVRRYRALVTPDIINSVKDWLAAANPGIVTKEDLARLESKLDELNELVDEIEERLDARLGPPEGDVSSP